MVKLLFTLLLLVSPLELAAQETITVVKRVWIDDLQSWSEPDEISTYEYDARGAIVKGEIKGDLLDETKEIYTFSWPRSVDPRYLSSIRTTYNGPTFQCLKKDDLLFLSSSLHSLNEDGTLWYSTEDFFNIDKSGRVISREEGDNITKYTYNTHGDLLAKDNRYYSRRYNRASKSSTVYAPHFDSVGRIVAIADYHSFSDDWSFHRFDSQVFIYGESGELREAISYGNASNWHDLKKVRYYGWDRFDSTIHPDYEDFLIGGDGYTSKLEESYTIRGRDTVLNGREIVDRFYVDGSKYELDSFYNKDGTSLSLWKTWYPQGDLKSINEIEWDTNGAIVNHYETTYLIEYLTGNRIAHAEYRWVDVLDPEYQERYRYEFTYTLASVPETDLLPQISVYPNPASSVISFRFEGETDVAEIRNVLGFSMRKVNVMTGLNQVDISDLQNGSYWLMLPDRTVVGFVKE